MKSVTIIIVFPRKCSINKCLKYKMLIHTVCMLVYGFGIDGYLKPLRNFHPLILRRFQWMKDI